MGSHINTQFFAQIRGSRVDTSRTLEQLDIHNGEVISLIMNPDGSRRCLSTAEVRMSHSSGLMGRQLDCLNLPSSPSISPNDPVYTNQMFQKLIGMMHTLECDISTMKIPVMNDTLLQVVTSLKSVEKAVTQLYLMVAGLDKRLVLVERSVRSLKPRRELDDGIHREDSYSDSIMIAQLMELLRQQTKQLEILTSENQELRHQVNMVVLNQDKLFSTMRSCDAELPIPSNSGDLVPPHRGSLLEAYREIFMSWLPDQKELVCRYHGNEHGWLAYDFHRHCDDQGPTLVIIRSTSGAIFGGYTAIGFPTAQGDSVFIHDDDSFMFIIHSPFLDDCPRKLNALKGQAGITVCKSYGPVFGRENEECLVICSNCIENSSNTYYFPCCYDAHDLMNASINGDPYFLVSDIEVYCHYSCL